MFAVHRLARTSPQQAARALDAAWRRAFRAEDRAYVWGMIAYLGAMRHDADALAWYARAGDLSDLQLAWKARAALRARNWQEVLAAIDAMTAGGELGCRVALLEGARAEGARARAPRPTSS